MSEFLRKYWFVTLIGVAFVCVLIYFIIDLNKDNVSSKKVDGQDVVATTTLGDITSSNLYDELSPSSSSVLYSLYRNEVVSQSVKSDKDMESQAKQMAKNIENNMKSDSTGQTRENIIQQLASFGFTGDNAPYDYALTMLKTQKLDFDYVKNHLSELKGLLPEGGRTISIITMEVPNDQILTEAGQKKQDDIQKALDEGRDFAEIAKEFSEDATAADGGFYGYIDSSNTDLDEAVRSAALALNKGEVSDWISVQPDGMQMFTLYRVYVNETDPEAILNGDNSEAAQALVTSMTGTVSGLETAAVDEAAKTLSITFENEDTKKMIEDSISTQLDAFNALKEQSAAADEASSESSSSENSASENKSSESSEAASSKASSEASSAEKEGK